MLKDSITIFALTTAMILVTVCALTYMALSFEHRPIVQPCWMEYAPTAQGGFRESLNCAR